VSQKLLYSKVPRTTLQFFLQQMLEMSPTGLKAVHQWRSEEACPDMSSGPWGTFPTSAVGRIATWYVVLYCTVTFETLCTSVELPSQQLRLKQSSIVVHLANTLKTIQRLQITFNSRTQFYLTRYVTKTVRGVMGH
jgi:hypothetical protein